VWRVTPDAAEDIGQIGEYGAETFGDARAARYLDGLRRLFGLLAENPHMGRAEERVTPPVRWFRYRSHRVMYRIEGDDVTILRVVHGMRDLDKLFE
jgi:toxin ParE1/3/4